MKKHLFKLIFGLIVFISLPFCINKSVNAASYNTKEMRSFVRTTLAQNRARGSVVIVKDGHPQQISYGYGYYGRRLGNGNAKVLYPVCSLQKVITGAVIMQLVDEGKLSTNTKISKWYPQIQNGKKITVGNLLTHTSGIILTGTEVNRRYHYSENKAIDWVVQQVNARKENKPGSFSYNNTNYILLAGIIRKVTGKSYASNVKNRVIKPLKLKHTYFYDDIPSSKTDAISYIFNGRNYQNPLYVKRAVASQIPGAGNLFSTPMDYYKIQLGLTNGKILTRAQFDTLTNLPVRANTYSGGLYLKKNRSIKSAYGNLYQTHFANWFQMTTDNKNGMIMFLNQTNGNENTNKAIGYQILNHIKPNTFSAN